jgi:hypothetical protein
VEFFILSNTSPRKRTYFERNIRDIRGYPWISGYPPFVALVSPSGA